MVIIKNSYLYFFLGLLIQREFWWSFYFSSGTDHHWNGQTEKGSLKNTSRTRTTRSSEDALAATTTVGMMLAARGTASSVGRYRPAPTPLYCCIYIAGRCASPTCLSIRNCCGFFFVSMLISSRLRRRRTRTTSLSRTHIFARVGE